MLRFVEMVLIVEKDWRVLWEERLFRQQLVYSMLVGQPTTTTIVLVFNIK